jgi:tRNA U34 2-thiouridine synthase MnmA/TrmU
MADIKPQPVRALSLLSGGLDSRLAVCVLREQGVEVHGVVFESPFFTSAAAREAAQQLRIPLHVLPFTDDIIGLVRHPPHGFGAGMNPCIDCHARMLRRAGAFMDEFGFHLLSTGEVLDERPMSQNRRSLEIVARESGYADLVLRPLSARLLPETKPETMGWVDRARLLDLRGRNRKPQMELAVRYGITHYPTPAGGCLLTEPNFAARLRDLKAHEGLDDIRAVERLRAGRHFRLDNQTKLVVGRDRHDNAWMEEHAGPGDLLLSIEEVPGPSALLPATTQDALVEKAAAICARYADCESGSTVVVLIRGPNGDRRMAVKPAAPSAADSLMVRLT